MSKVASRSSLQAAGKLLALPAGLYGVASPFQSSSRVEVLELPVVTESSGNSELMIVSWQVPFSCRVNVEFGSELMMLKSGLMIG
jgi:hypothetical protein